MKPLSGFVLQTLSSQVHQSRWYKQTTLLVTKFGKSGKFSPSDDSEYNQNDRFLNQGLNSTLFDNLHFFKESKGNYHRISRMTIESALHFDPVDAIADWVSDRFFEQSLQWESSSKVDNKLSSSVQPAHNFVAESYILESYCPGSMLDTIAQASSPYTPLSYQIRTLVRVLLPSIIFAAIATSVYPSIALWLVSLPSPSSTNDQLVVLLESKNLLYSDQVYTVLSNDLSQYVQNILTTSALLFGMLVGQTYYFMYQQQEQVFYALFAEVTEAKSLLEQISLLSYGRPGLYPSLLSRMNDYVQNDLKLLSTREPTALLSRLPKEDPLESLLYATSVGVPGVAYDTVKSLRQARATRCAALQRKLPNVHIFLLRLLGVIALTTFPVCGSGSQAIAPNVLLVQSYMFGILVFALTIVLNVVEELRNLKKKSAYNVDGALNVMIGGLEKELRERLEGKIWTCMNPSLPLRSDIGSASDKVYIDQSYMNFRAKKSLQSSNERTLIIEESGVTNVLPYSRRKRIKEWLQRKIHREI